MRKGKYRAIFYIEDEDYGHLQKPLSSYYRDKKKAVLSYILCPQGNILINGF